MAGGPPGILIQGLREGSALWKPMASVLEARGQWATGVASREGSELKLADGHHASVEAALVMALVFLFGGHDLLLLAHRAVPGVGKLEGKV